MRVPFVDLRAQDEPIAGEIMRRIQAVVDRSDYIMGREVHEFEEAFAAFCEADHCVSVANGTDALTLTLRALGIGAGDEVIVPANTFVATAAAVSLVGARPVFVDILPGTATIDPALIGARVTEKTRAVIAVHLYGRIADMSGVCAAARQYGLQVIEDAAQAHGARLDGGSPGSFGRAATFSFYPAKNLGCYGDGGAVVTNDATLAEDIRRLRDHGGEQKYQHEVVGTNSRLDTVQAAVLLAKLPLLEDWNGRRRMAAAWYDERLSHVNGIVTLEPARTYSHVYHLYVIRISGGNREAIRASLSAHGVMSGLHYPQPVHRTAAFASADGHAACPVADSLGREVLSLPMHPHLTVEDADLVQRELVRALGAAVPPSG